MRSFKNCESKSRTFGMVRLIWSLGKWIPKEVLVKDKKEIR